VSSTVQRVNRLLGYLDADPQNLQLIADAAEAAMEAHRYATVDALVERHAALQPPPSDLLNLAGLAAMRDARFERAEDLLARAVQTAPDDPALRYNLAWAKAARKDWAGASALLDRAVADAVPAAAVLNVQMLHQLGRLDDALAWGKVFAEAYPDDQPLHGALSAVAMDAEDMALAADFAKRAGDAPEALATLGMLGLDAAQLDQSTRFFDQALAGNPQCMRAQLGQGLVSLALARHADAAEKLDRVAAFYGDHLGSWIAAGWAYFSAGDLVRARQRFETAMAIDATLAEAQGAIAVLEAVDSQLDSARRRAQAALRLDRQCFSAALAMSLVLDATGQPTAAERLRLAALRTPVGPSGQSISGMMVILGNRRR
jgi:Tfp pilus assembly protein PilF